MKNETIFELYTDDNKSKYCSNPLNILNKVHQVHFHIDCPITSTLTLHKTKIKQMNPVSNACIFYTETSLKQSK